MDLDSQATGGWRQETWALESGAIGSLFWAAEITLHWAWASSWAGRLLLLRYLLHVCEAMRYQGFAILTFGTFLDTTGMLKAAVRRNELLGSPCLTFPWAGKDEDGDGGIRRTEKRDKFVGLPVLLSVGLLLAPYVSTLI